MKGHIYRRSATNWKLILELGRDSNGKRQQKSSTIHGTKKDAERELTRLIHELETGGYCEPTRLLVSEYLERWLADYAKPKVSAKTFERYESICRQHLIPALGHHKLVKLQPWHIQKAYADALLGGRKDGKEGGLSRLTVLHHHRVLKCALHQAVQLRLLYYSPTDRVQPPRAEPHEMRALDEEQTARLLQMTRNTELYVPILLAVSTGLRRGELLALRWQDVSLADGTLTVRQATEQTREFGIGFKQPKSVKGRRKVPLPSVLVEALKKYHTDQTRHRMATAGYVDNDLVFAGPKGAVWNPRTFSSSFFRLVKKAGLPGVRFHDLRHSHASQLLLHGIHPKVVSERLGHSTVGITLDTYSHVLPGLQEEAAECVDAALRKAIAATS